MRVRRAWARRAHARRPRERGYHGRGEHMRVDLAGAKTTGPASSRDVLHGCGELAGAARLAGGHVATSSAGASWRTRPACARAVAAQRASAVTRTTRLLLLLEDATGVRQESGGAEVERDDQDGRGAGSERGYEERGEAAPCTGSALRFVHMSCRCRWRRGRPAGRSCRQEKFPVGTGHWDRGTSRRCRRKPERPRRIRSTAAKLVGCRRTAATRQQAMDWRPQAPGGCGGGDAGWPQEGKDGQGRRFLSSQTSGHASGCPIPTSAASTAAVPAARIWFASRSAQRV